MGDRTEWGPWIEHDGHGKPALPRGRTVLELQIGPGKMSRDGDTLPAVHWVWTWKQVRAGWFRWELRPVCSDGRSAPILRYRIRKPRGLIILQDLIENLPLPAPVREWEGS